MNISPLQLEHYFVSDLHFTVSRRFDAGKPVEIVDEQFAVQSHSLRAEEASQQWQITLQLKYQPAPAANSPYSFTLEIVGLFKVARGYPAERTEQLVKTNGSSIIYGIAREIVRDITSRGPHAGLMLPSVSFFEPAKKTDASPPTARQEADKERPEPGLPEDKA